MKKKKSIGLPGGPNQYITHVSEMFSTEGYKRNSPDVNNPFNIIPSADITMKGVDFPVRGYGNNGIVQDMIPGKENYNYGDADYVVEVPMAQYGIENKYPLPKRNGVRLNYDAEGNVNGESSHLMKAEVVEGKWYGFPTLFQNEDGTWDNTYENLIKENDKDWMPAFEEAKRRGELIEFGDDAKSAIKFGEGSWKPKFQSKGETQRATISQYEEPAWYEKALDYLASPMTALSYITQGKDLPDRLPINAENRNAYDMVIDMVNPAAMIKYGAQAKRDYDNEEYLNATLNTFGALPIVPAVLSQGKNVAKGGKNIIKNSVKSADEVFANSDDIIKTTVKDAKPNAKRFDGITEVNPLSQNQAKNLAEQGRNKEIFEAFEEGANTIDDFVKSYSGDLSSPEGFKRLVNQEADYLRSIGFDEARIATQAEINAGARLNEVVNIINTNKAISNGYKGVDAITSNKYNFNNASYTANTRGMDYFDDLFFKEGMDAKLFSLNKTKVGANILPGQTNLGTMYGTNKAVAAHEIGGHGLQSGRRLPLDSRLKKLEPLTDMNENTAEAYKYFMKGSKGKEPSAYLHELRQTLLDNKLIKNRYDHISSDQLKRFQTLFDLKPSGTINTMADKFHSNTRILDFMKPTQTNFSLLARELNKLPAMVPMGLTGAAGAAALSQERYGGQLPKAQRGYAVKPKSIEQTPEEKYYNPEVEENITTGDWKQDFLYNNQWLMDAPLVGDYIKNQARKVAETSAGERRSEYDIQIALDPDSTLNQSKDTRPRYSGWATTMDGYDNKDQTSLMDQYFSEEPLFPVSQYKPKSDYLEFLPSYSIKARLDKDRGGDQSYKDRRDQGLEFTIRDAFKKFAGQDGTDNEYTFEDITKSKEFTEFLKNKKTIFMTNDLDEGSYLSDALGLDLGGHKTGVAWDEELNLPYVSISDAWDFSPDHYSEKWSGNEEERQTSKIQASLMHKAGHPFKIYDRFYFDPKSQDSKIKYYTDSEIKERRSKTLPNKQNGNGEYTVKSGDTFYGIANKNNLAWEALKEANPNLDYDNLKLDQSIVIPNKIDKSPNVTKLETPKESVQDFQITPQLLYKQAYVESSLDPNAKNSKGYMGLGQIGEGLIKDYKKANKVDTVDPFDPKQNHDIQAWSMNELFNSSFIDKPGSTMENRLLKTLASYNWGRGNVLDLLEVEKAKGADIYKSTEWMQHLPKETKEYIQMIVYNGKTEKRPLIQENFLKATTEEKYKDLRTLYNYKQGGELTDLTVYKNYMTGKYDNTEMEAKGKKVYDKLNRVYYRKAKLGGTTSPNYIMSSIIRENA